MSFILSITLLLVVCSLGLGNRTNIVFVIPSQQNSYHRSLARTLKDGLFQQSRSLFGHDPIVYITKENMQHSGDWTIIPILFRLASLHADTSWFVFLQDFTQVVFKELTQVLFKYNPKQQVLLGHAMNDEEPVILHHFHNPEDLEAFKFPNFASGYAMSGSLLITLADRIKENHLPARIDFNIDPSHELARFIFDVTGRMVIHDAAFCIHERSGCATFPRSNESCDKKNLPPSTLYYAIKTCTKFHTTRVPIVKNTWGRYVQKLNFFSDSTDKFIPTIDIGLENTPQGHCAKTVAILKYVAQKLGDDPNIRWIVLADDDTILSPSALLRLLSCYDPTEPVALGERYGFKVHQHGYNYLTGGAGSVFSRPMLQKLVSGERFMCRSPDDPDDMFLGAYMTNLDLPATHHPAFHQARPVDYPAPYRQSVKAVSFHKHFMIDPVKVYEEWFQTQDREFFEDSVESMLHNEL